MRNLIKFLAILALAFIFSATILFDGGQSPLNVGNGSGTINPLPVRTFLGLTDTPNSYSGQGGKVVAVNGAENALEFVTSGGGLTIGTTAITSGTDTRVLFNDGGVVGEDAGFTFTKATDALLVGGATSIGSTLSGTAKGLIVNNNTSTGNIFEAQDNGTAVFTIADGGQVTAIGTASGVSAPQYSFIGDTDTGLMRTGANTLNIQAGGQYTGLLIGGSTLGIGWSTATVSTGNGTGDVTFTSSGYATGVAITGGFKINPNTNYGYMTNVALFNSNPTNFTNYSIAGTYANFATHRFGVMNMTVNAGQALTITDNATVKIDGAPTVSGAGIVQTNAHALWVVGGQSTFGGDVVIGKGSTSSGILKILEDTDNGSNYTTFQVPTLTGNVVYILPPDDGDAGEQLQTNGSGVLTWEAAGSGGAGTPGGSDTQVQFNDSSTFGGDAGLTYNKTTDALTAVTFIGALTGNATTATALAADPADCGANTFADAINASGTLTCNSIVSADITDGTITIADTAITAGRSLTISTNDILADAELYTDTKCLWFENPTAADDFKSVWFAKQAATITSLWCESDQTVTAMLQVDDGSAADVDSVDLTCDATPPEDTSLNGDATLASGDRLDLDVASVASTPTWVSICWTFTYDD